MRAQTGIRSVPGTARIREAKLLLVGGEDNFQGDVAGEMMRGERSHIVERSATLLGALARLDSEGIDVVLLSYKFRDEELALFTADARRGGYQGFILRVASVDAHALFKDSLPSPHAGAGAHRENHRTSGGIYFTDKQQSVLAHVSQGWTNKQIALHMKCTEAAIKAVVQELFRKLEVRKRARIVRVAIEKGLVKIGGRPAGRGKETRQATLAPA